jgi:hemerythrin-like domain-containing protein
MARADVIIPKHCPASMVGLRAVPHALLATPLDFLAADSSNLRCVCAYVKRMAAEGRVSGAEADALANFLSHDLPIHRRDENDDLFPALRRRARADDNLDQLLDGLEEDHRQVEPLVEAILRACRRPQGDAMIPLHARSTKAMKSYADTMLRHLSIENSVVLVLARKRLTSSDLATMSHKMAERRGVRV